LKGKAQFAPHGAFALTVRLRLEDLDCETLIRVVHR
jgi:hypothetical protein